MTDSPAPRRAIDDRFYIVFASVMLLFVSAGGMYLIVVAMKEVAREFDWPRAVPSLAFSLQFAGSGFGGIFMGWVLDRKGMGVPALVGTVMVSIGAMLVSGIDAAWQLYLIYGFMFGLAGQGSLAAPAMANIARWFDKRRGMAVGIVSSGQALAGIVWPPIFGHFMEAVGWRDMFFWFGVFCLSVMLPLCMLVRRKPPPVKISSAQGGGSATGSVRKSVGEPEAAPRARPMTPNAIQCTLCCAIFGCCVAMALPLGHLVAYATDAGLPMEQATLVLSLTLMATFASRVVLVGLLSDRLGGLRALFIFSGVQASMLALLTTVNDFWALTAVGIMFGLGYGGVFPVYTVAIRDHLPITQIGWRTGVIFMFGAVAMGFGGWMGGYLYDVTGAYTLPFLIGAGFNIVNLIIVAGLIQRLKPRAARMAAA